MPHYVGFSDLDSPAQRIYLPFYTIIYINNVSIYYPIAQANDFDTSLINAPVKEGIPIDFSIEHEEDYNKQATELTEY